MNSVQGAEADGLLAERVFELINATADYAANSPSRCGTGEVFVGAQGCTPDLTGDQCRSCIVNISSKIPTLSVASLLITSQVAAKILGVIKVYTVQPATIEFSSSRKQRIPSFSTGRRELKLWEKEIISESDPGFSLYKFAEIKDSTEISNKLGEGGFGPVFQAKKGFKESVFQ
uniref:Gnk2-homologous domain-containing protein n=1 Tax=Leersia perrieri TaxID=77586 RepID=A0A0D9V0J2_9ORYZ